MTPSPMPAAAVGGVPDWVPIAALAISLLAFGAAVVNTWVNLRSWRDKRSVHLTLIRSAEPAELFRGMKVASDAAKWTLFNAGEGSLVSPTVKLHLTTGLPNYVDFEGPLHGKSSLDGRYRFEMFCGDSLEADLYGAKGEAEWVDSRGKRRTARVVIQGSR
ncbi:hypothetical protein HOW07_09505 [Plantibacter sp. MCCC 1A11337]|uniref:hypothetical protein n=1 Tax=Plantibacter sp. MCCC 1A11337 TaxID=2736644 RepID=UPI0015838DA7|nr:hypothetical protein [Plantibacter sp. MCCC 1A11337]NUJ88244.1 hypothetical protein [Plantibacter sp. MCCC 1A11337]